MNYAVTYLSVLAPFVLCDFVWLSTMVPRLYRPIMGDLLMDQAKFPAIVVFYLMYPVGITLFAVLPALKTGEWKAAALFGALFGLFTYATYDLTNQATLRNWTTLLTVVDIAWGCTLGAIAATCSFWVSRKFA